VGNRKQAGAQDGYIGEPGRAGSLRNDTFDDVLTALAMIYLFIIACCKIIRTKRFVTILQEPCKLGDHLFQLSATSTTALKESGL